MKKKLSISDIKPTDIVVEMAEELKIEHKQVGNESSLQLPEEFGNGTVWAVNFEMGFGVIETDYILKKDFHFTLEKGEVHPLKIMFNTDHAFKHKFEHEDEYSNVERLHSVLANSTRKSNHQFLIPANKRCRIFSLEINRKLFEERIISFKNGMDEELEELFRDLNGVNIFEHHMPFTHKIAELIEQFRQCDLTGFFRQVYLEAKAYEIFAHFMKQFKEDLKGLEDRTILRQYTVDAVQKASQHIVENLANLENVQDIAALFGVNANTLQHGFKNVHGQTVGEYIQGRRLTEGRKLLVETNLSISEIVYKVGLTSKSYFSKVFLEKYGIPPSVFRKEINYKSGTDDHNF